MNNRNYLTNFKPELLPIYEACVAKFPDEFGIERNPMPYHRNVEYRAYNARPGDFCLFTTRNGDCSDFWAAFRKLEEATEGRE